MFNSHRVIISERTLNVFPPLIGDADGLEGVPKRKGPAFPVQLILQLLGHRLNIRHWLIR